MAPGSSLDTAVGWWEEQRSPCHVPLVTSPLPVAGGRTRVGSGLARESSIFLLAKEALP
jgi:hypothetical protein